MDYKLKIDGITDLDTTKAALMGGCVKNIEIMTDTVEEYAKERFNEPLFRFKIVFEINADTKAVAKDMMKWSLQRGTNEVYRNVQLTVLDNGGNKIRMIKIPNMFCEDYIEIYEELNDKSQTKPHPYATLKLIQRGGETDKIANEV